MKDKHEEAQMSYKLPNCKITVLKRTLHQDLVEEYLEVEDEFVA